MEYGAKVYGVLVVSAPVEFIEDEEEQSLLQEVAGDIAFALYNMELEEEHKKAEQELKLKAQLLDEATDAIFLHDFDGNLIYVNETCCKVHGYTREELMGMGLRQLGTPQYDRLIEQRLQRVKEEGKGIFETAHMRKDGSVLPMEVHSRVVESGGGKLLLTIARDITERKQMEAERKEMEQKAQLASRLASIGEMASGITHEINNPLVGVIGFAQLLMRREDLPEDVREELKVIHDGGQRVASIVKGLLSFARQSKPERTYVDINQIIEISLKLRVYEMQTANIEVITQLDPELPGTMADAGQLHQVFLNIII
ncbi:MAG: PAS domain S-box protein, partial [Dehalococcoidia bacterium]|nr:PAS domain S-box protein [Dehalococcoidia bacterium]